jgi:3'-5' exoribonuclease
MDSRVYEMKEAVEATAPDDFTGRLWAMDNRKLYNHNRIDIKNKTKIF